MFNRFIVRDSHTKFRKLNDQEKKNQAWIKRYKTQVRPNLIGKYQRRIQGFAKRMECQPVILPEKNLNNDFNQFKLQLNTDRSRKKFKSSAKINTQYTRSARIKTQHSFSNIQNLKLLIAQKYINPMHSFRNREKDQQINPPMKYGNNNSKLIIKTLANMKKKVKDLKIQQNQKQMVERNRSRSRESLTPIKNQSQHESYTDVLTNLQAILIQNGQKFKNEAQKKQEQQLKALSHDRLYFKSLLNYQQGLKDKIVKENIKNILVKCKVVKPAPDKQKKQSIQRDYLIQMFSKH